MSLTKYAKQLCKELVLHADETTLQVLKEPGQKSPASADPWAAFGKAVGYRREVCGRTHPDNLHQPDSQQD